MRSIKLIGALFAITACGVTLAAQPTVFDISGTIEVYGSGVTPDPFDSFSGSIDINTLTGVVTGGDVQFGSPATGITVPPMTFNGFESGPGGPGTHVAVIELCAAAVCSENWYLDMTVNVTNEGGTLVGYTGGKIAGLGLWYADVPSAWGACPGQTGEPNTCGLVTTKSGGGGTKPGVPEPASAVLMLLGLAATQVRRRLRAG